MNWPYIVFVTHFRWTPHIDIFSMNLAWFFPLLWSFGTFSYFRLFKYYFMLLETSLLHTQHFVILFTVSAVLVTDIFLSYLFGVWKLKKSTFRFILAWVGVWVWRVFERSVIGWQFFLENSRFRLCDDCWRGRIQFLSWRCLIDMPTLCKFGRKQFLSSFEVILFGSLLHEFKFFLGNISVLLISFEELRELPLGHFRSWNNQFLCILFFLHF